MRLFRCGLTLSLRVSVAIPLVSFLSGPTIAQQTVRLDSPCIVEFVPEPQFPEQFVVYDASFEDGKQAAERKFLEEAVRKILDAVGVLRDISIYNVNVPNACATVQEATRKRMIYVSGSWLDAYTGGKEWGKLGVIAHEIGHHLNNHTFEGPLQTWQREYEADRFAGKIVRLLGGSLDEALIFTTGLAPAPPKYPPRAVRITAVQEGYGKPDVGVVRDKCAGDEYRHSGFLDCRLQTK